MKIYPFSRIFSTFRVGRLYTLYTFEAETHIDIEAIANELKILDSKMLEIDKMIADFCKELGIETPF